MIYNGTPHKSECVQNFFSLKMASLLKVHLRFARYKGMAITRDTYPLLDEWFLFSHHCYRIVRPYYFLFRKAELIFSYTLRPGHVHIPCVSLLTALLHWPCVYLAIQMSRLWLALVCTNTPHLPTHCCWIISVLMFSIDIAEKTASVTNCIVWIIIVYEYIYMNHPFYICCIV